MKNLFFLFLLLAQWYVNDAQNVGVGTTNPMARLHVADSNVVFSASDAVPLILGNPPITGKGKRMMWYADKAAFRVGLVDADQWDKNNTGAISIAMGESTKASAKASTAFGHSTIASGDYSTAMGFGSIADAIFSTAMGNNTIASGNYSTSMGSNTSANGLVSTATGYQTSASGVYSTSMGSFTTANAQTSLAIGRYNDSVTGANEDQWIVTDPLFYIGNGSNNANRHNAMMVLKNGNVGIGTSAPVTKLQITEGSDASLIANSGFMVIGNTTAANLVFDDNEIEARINGVNSTLFFQHDGGALETNGTASKPGGGAWLTISDSRLKQNIKPYNEGLQQLLKIKPVYFQYNQLSGYNTEKEYVGVVAQELNAIAPYMVQKKENGFLEVDNSAMTYMLINAVKEQQQTINEQNEKLATQQKQIDELRKILLARN
jgi:hypothetical protein